MARPATALLLCLLFSVNSLVQSQSNLTENIDEAYARCGGRSSACRIDNLLLSSAAGGSFVFVGTSTFIGSSPASKIVLNPVSPIIVSAGKLSLIGASIYGSSFTLDPPMPYEDISLSGINMVPGGEGRLEITNSSIYLDCGAWSNLFDVLCDHGLAPGRVKVRDHQSKSVAVHTVKIIGLITSPIMACVRFPQVHHGGPGQDLMTVHKFSTAGITWTNVSLPYPPTCPPLDKNHAGCVIQLPRPGGEYHAPGWPS